MQRLSVTDDPALAVAFSSALRTATSPSLGPDGEVEARRVHWVDSAELRKQLADVNKAGRVPLTRSDEEGWGPGLGRGVP